MQLNTLFVKYFSHLTLRYNQVLLVLLLLSWTQLFSLIYPSAFLYYQVECPKAEGSDASFSWLYSLTLSLYPSS